MPRFVALALALSIVARPSAARVDASIDSSALRDAGALLDVPSDDAAWYAAASWDENHYARALGTSTGRATTVTTTAELLAALRDPLVEFVGVNATTLTLDEDAWPRRGVAVRRRATLRGIVRRTVRRRRERDERGERRRRWESQRGEIGVRGRARGFRGGVLLWTRARGRIVRRRGV